MSLKISEAIVTWLLSSACVYAGTCVQSDCCCKSKELVKESSQPSQGKTTASFPLLLLPAWVVKKPALVNLFWLIFQLREVLYGIFSE